MTKSLSGRGRSKAKGKARVKAAVTPTPRTPDAVSEGRTVFLTSRTGEEEEVEEVKNLYNQTYIVEAIVRLLIVNEKICRPPRQAAKLLAYIVELHRLGKPFPSRAEVSAILDMSIPTIDAALSSRLQEGYIDLDVKIAEGNIERRPSSIRQRYYTPSTQLTETVDIAHQRGQVRK